MESSISSIHSSNSNPISPTICLRNASHLGLRLHGLRDDAELHCHLGPMMQPYEYENENEDASVVSMEDCNQVFPSQWSNVDLDAPNVSQSVIGSSIDTLDVFDVGHNRGHDPEELKCMELSPTNKPLSFRAKKGGPLKVGSAAHWLEWTKSIRVLEIYSGKRTSEETTPPLSSGHDGNC
eukprot:scaffold7275_cov45-Attheya_sp.AAC.3